jgi:hypothetical protein
MRIRWFVLLVLFSIWPFPAIHFSCEVYTYGWVGDRCTSTHYLLYHTDTIILWLHAITRWKFYIQFHLAKPVYLPVLARVLTERLVCSLFARRGRCTNQCARPQRGKVTSAAKRARAARYNRALVSASAGVHRDILVCGLANFHLVVASDSVTNITEAGIIPITMKVTELARALIVALWLTSALGGIHKGRLHLGGRVVSQKRTGADVGGGGPGQKRTSVKNGIFCKFLFRRNISIF